MKTTKLQCRWKRLKDGRHLVVKCSGPTSWEIKIDGKPRPLQRHKRCEKGGKKWTYQPQQKQMSALRDDVTELLEEMGCEQL